MVEITPPRSGLVQQQITDFISSHLNFEFVNLLSVICKVDTCEVAMSEKETVESYLQNGGNPDEIQSFIDNEVPKYKVIFDELRVAPELNMQTGIYMPGRFNIYDVN